MERTLCQGIRKRKIVMSRFEELAQLKLEMGWKNASKYRIE